MGDIFFLTVGFNNDYLVGLGKDPNNVVLGQNQWGLSDVAYDTDVPFNTQTPWVPVPEPTTGLLALAGAGALLNKYRRRPEKNITNEASVSPAPYDVKKQE